MGFTVHRQDNRDRVITNSMNNRAILDLHNQIQSALLQVITMGY